MHAIVHQHEPGEGLGWLEPPLRAAGFVPTTRFRAPELTDADADLLVVLGGAMGAGDGAVHAFVDVEVEVLRRRLQAGRPSLGICLGAQLLAKAAGARVFRGERGLEVGALPITWTAAGLADPVTGAGERALERELVVAHWHQDTFDAVPGAQLLASSTRYEQQAFRLGSSYAFQFHLELGADEFRTWLRGGRTELAAGGFDAEALQAELPRLRAADAPRRALLERLARSLATAVRRRGQ
ncbi:MAG: glutamine amidotransferase [Planctomycetes bacterium]|jgi:GMP synthase (glutamine-hydrolysing)|nr:glutamine amidotransferase [Planctomycetota bacterium]